ncbi:MAG: YraN family protein [Patescibacteria group bacterium]|nr:YraN family protein [Patescibacteria group bacterium]
MHNQNIGRIGEKRAEEYYIKQGFKVLFRNFRTPFGEIDLIVSRNNLTVFVEVKCRISTNFGYPEEYINKRKLNKIKKGVQFYALKNESRDLRIDVVSVILSADGEVKDWQVYENVYA